MTPSYHDLYQSPFFHAVAMVSPPSFLSGIILGSSSCCISYKSATGIFGGDEKGQLGQYYGNSFVQDLRSIANCLVSAFLV
jgi:hypothetical protein